VEGTGTIQMKNKIAIVGEAWGELEALRKKPFVGPAGQELNIQLEMAEINRDDCFVTNVFNVRPHNNHVEALCVTKVELPDDYPPSITALSPARWIKPEYLPELDRLRAELTSIRPNVIIALGNTACWAILHTAGISKIRGAVATSVDPPGIKVVPTFHPAAVLRENSLRSICVADLIKAKIESEYPETRLKMRSIWLEPSLTDLWDFERLHIRPASSLCFDIETAHGQITCIGFAPSPSAALVVPFVDLRRPSGSYWPSEVEEVAAWAFVRTILSSPIPKVGQNGLYDIQWLLSRYRINVRNYADDTMLLHHSLHPELDKGLGFLGSIYTNEGAWKVQRPRGQKMEAKADE
jgi:DNA polymerase